MKLYYIAKIIRSKNAGPFTLTLDVIFECEKDFDAVQACPSFCEANVARLYHADESQVKIHPFKRILAIKVTLPRPVSSGAIGDCDVYGSGQHFPLGNIEI